MRVVTVPVMQSRQRQSALILAKLFSREACNEDPTQAQNSELVAELGESKHRPRLTAAMTTSIPGTEHPPCWRILQHTLGLQRHTEC